MEVAVAGISPADTAGVAAVRRCVRGGGQEDGAHLDVAIEDGSDGGDEEADGQRDCGNDVPEQKQTWTPPAISAPAGGREFMSVW